MILECNRLWQYQQTETGLILPYYTLPCLEWLVKQDISEWNVFEFGAGYSSIWWRAHCNTLTSIDHSKTWAKGMMAEWITDKTEFIEYIAKHSKLEEYNCIIVDSEYWREECSAFCIPYLKSGGYLIIDNYESENYDPKVNEHLFKDWPIQIFKQPNHSTWQTAVLTKP